MRKNMFRTITLFILILSLTACSAAPATSPSSVDAAIPGQTTNVKPTENATQPVIQPSTAATQPTTQPTEPATEPTMAPTEPTEPTQPTQPPVDNSATPTIYLVGDSTVKTYESGQYIAGWGQYLDLFLDEQIRVVNAAHGGRSSRSFINEGRLYDIDDADFTYSFSQNDGNSIEDCIQAGDFLFIQFGHNDDDTKAASSYATMFDRMVPLGKPDENGVYPVLPATQTSTGTLPAAYTALATDAEEAAALREIAKYGATYYAYDGGGTYKWYLKQYIDFARSVGAIPVLVTPVARVKFSNGEIIGGAGLHGENFAYVEAVRQLALEENCLLLDLFAESKRMLETATPVYANFLMALKPNDLTGAWPSGYDSTYADAKAGYTGIEATHYNKYGAFLQAAKIAELILSNTETVNETERFNFSDHILTTPESYIDPSNLLSKSVVTSIEALLEVIEVTNPNRVYPSAEDVVASINAMVALGEVNQENYLDFQVTCEQIRNEYDKLNVDDRAQVTNLTYLEAYEAAVDAFVIASRPEPTRVVIFRADELTLENYDSTVAEGEFILVATSNKTMARKGKKVTFTYADVTYTTTYGLSLGGKATFGSNRYVSFTVDSPCTITIATQSSSNSEARTLLLVDGDNANVASFEAGTSVTVSSVEISEAGTYSVGSAGSGIYIYVIIIEYFD